MDFEKDDMDRAGRIAWAESIQQREADVLSAELAKAIREGHEAGEAHLALLKERLKTLGYKTGDVDRELVERALAEQLHVLDEPAVRSFVDHQIGKLKVAAARLGITNFETMTVTASSMPTGTVNAICAKDPYDQTTHIFTDAELLIFCQVFAKCVASSVSTIGPFGEPRVTLRSAKAPLLMIENSEFRRRLGDLFVSVLFTGRARASQPWIPEAHALEASAILTNGMERFAIAHELAHSAEGHLDTNSLGAAEAATDESIAFSQQQEVDADMLAAKLCVEACIKEPEFEIEVLAPYIFLKGISLLEACQHVFSDSASGQSLSHPASEERLAAVKTIILSTRSDDIRRIVYIRSIVALDFLFDLWKNFLVDTMSHLQANGYVPRIEKVPVRPKIDHPNILG